MFKSKRRPIVIPQAEHLKLVGTLALLWGNPDFDAPPIERNSLIAGIGLHDRGYGPLDTSPIGGMKPEEWQVIARRGFTMPVSDPVADLITKYHIRRLASQDVDAEKAGLTAEFSRVIDEIQKKQRLEEKLFQRIDRITQLCDSISYTFCFDEPGGGKVYIYPRNVQDREISVEFSVADGVIHVSPWPFSVQTYEGYIYGYKLESYPDHLDPVVLGFRLMNK